MKDSALRSVPTVTCLLGHSRWKWLHTLHVSFLGLKGSLEIRPVKLL